MMTDIIDIERALTQYLAEKLNLTVDTDIFRGEMPVEKDGLCVYFTHGDDENRIGRRSYYLTAIIKYPDRDKVFQLSANLTGLFPLYGFQRSDSPVKLKAILKMMNRIIPTCPDGGRIKTVSECVLKVII